MLFVFFFNDTATTEIYTLSLHDALPILWTSGSGSLASRILDIGSRNAWRNPSMETSDILIQHDALGSVRSSRSEEHTSELQSHLNLVCRLLLEIGRAHV